MRFKIRKNEIKRKIEKKIKKDKRENKILIDWNEIVILMKNEIEINLKEIQRNFWTW